MVAYALTKKAKGESEGIGHAFHAANKLLGRQQAPNLILLFKTERENLILLLEGFVAR